MKKKELLKRRKALDCKRAGVEIKQTFDAEGHPTVTLQHRNGGTVVKRVCDLVATAFLPPKPEGAMLVHIDGDVTNNKATNLRWHVEDDDQWAVTPAQRSNRRLIASLLHLN